MNTFNMNNESRGNPLRPFIWGGAALALLAPWVAMQFAPGEVQWKPGDFLVFGAMLAIACGAYEVAARLSGNGTYRLAMGVAVIGGFLMTWANLAVGLIGNEDNPANLLFFGVLTLGLIGALMARFRAPGMVRTMLAMAVTQALVTGYVMWAGRPREFILTAFFIFVWLASAQLFRKASR